MRIVLLLSGLFFLVACSKKDINKDDISNDYMKVMTDSCFCILPNAFSPDNNGINDLLKPINKNVSTNDYEFTVRNKRQKVVFTTTDITKAWDGIEAGKSKAKSGNYIATIKGSLICGTSFENNINICSFINCVIIPDGFDLVFNNMIDGTSGQRIVPNPQNNEAFCP